jgi:hypothetical protein
MKKTTVRDLRYHSPENDALLSKGEEMSEDYSSQRRQIFGTKRVRKTGTDLASEEPGARLTAYADTGFLVLLYGQDSNEKSLGSRPPLQLQEDRAPFA